MPEPGGTFETIAFGLPKFAWLFSMMRLLRTTQSRPTFETLFGSTKKGNRPSYSRAAPPEVAIPLYESFTRRLSADLGRPIQTGDFGADMKIALVNDGPVTLIIDSKERQ